MDANRQCRTVSCPRRGQSMVERTCPACGWLTQQQLDEQEPNTASARSIPAQKQPVLVGGLGPRARMPVGARSTQIQTYPPGSINRLAKASLAVSLAGFLLPLAFPAGAIIGRLARGQIDRSNERGDGLAFAGVVIGWLGTVVTISVIGWLLGELPE